jgi:ABC-type transport system involved in cytochrome bd biosynthesis fused ATPase/permease subunit
LLAERMEAAIRAAGLRDDLIRLGLGAPAGSGGSNLSANARRRTALVRAMLKRPRLLILDGIAASADPADLALRAAIRNELPEAAIVFATTDGATGDADLAIKIDDDGNVRAEAVDPPGDTDSRDDETRGRQAP